MHNPIRKRQPITRRVSEFGLRYSAFGFLLLLLAFHAVAAPIRVALMSDTHWAAQTKTNQAAYRLHLDQAIQQINAAKVALVLVAGDLTENGATQDLKDVKQQFQKLQAPFLCVPGNHDIGGKVMPNGKEAKSNVTSKRIKQYEAVFGPSFYVKETAGVRVVGVNASLLGSGLPEEAAQWQLLEKELAKPAGLPTLLLQHYPVFLVKIDEPGGVYWNLEPEPRTRLLKLIKQAGIKTVLTGHTHLTVTHQVEGINFLTTPPISFGLPRGKQPEGWILLELSPQGDAKYQVQDLQP